MRRGTTPTIEYDIPFKAEEIDELWVTFSQGNNNPPTEVLTKTLEDEGVELEDYIVKITFSQADTLKFHKSGLPKVQSQLRILFTDGSADASNIISFNVGLILKDGVIS